MKDWTNFDKPQPCMTENHEVYLAGKGYVKVKDLKPDDVIINETGGKTNRIRVSDIQKFSVPEDR